MSQNEQKLDVLVEALREAALLCRRVQRSIGQDVLQKKDKSPVTVADFGSQAIVCRALHKAFPETPIIAEENSRALQKTENRYLLERVLEQVEQQFGAVSAEELFQWIDYGEQRKNCASFWTLDPIDGTKGFLRGEQYAISAAFIENGRIQVAALACPNLPVANGSQQTGTLLTAVQGHGAFQQSLFSRGQAESISVSQNHEIRDSRFCESVESGHSSHSDSQRLAEWLGITQEPVRLDSQAKYAVVARGEAEVYLRLPTRKDYREKIWDHAGGVLIVQEAGGTVTDVLGNPLDFSCGFELLNNRGVIVSNGAFHEHILRGLQSLQIVSPKHLKS